MTRRIMLAAVLAAIVASGTAASAQPPAPESVSLSVEVTISRYRGDELVGSRPYVLALTARPDEPFPRPDRHPNYLQMNSEVPVPQLLPANPDDAPTPDEPSRRFTYRSVGTLIECHGAIVGDDRYLITVRIDESSVYGEDATAMEAVRAPGVPVFRSFESNNSLLLRDGQASRYTAAADPVTGESIRVDVALTVLD